MSIPEFITVVEPYEILGRHDTERAAVQEANEAVLLRFQEVYVYRRLRKHWRVAVDDTPKEPQ